MNGFTDIHSHFVYGVDDGAQTREDMEAMLDVANANGITSLFATSHVTPGLQPFDYTSYSQHLQEARSYCQEKGYPIILYEGAEILYTPMINRFAMDRQLPTLADSKYILLEFMPDIDYGEIKTALSRMQRSGYTTILAHIERYSCLYKGHNAQSLKQEFDVLFQVNGSTVVASRGFFKDRCIKKWFQEELIDFVASDAHNCTSRPFKMLEAYNALVKQVGQDYAKQLTGLE